VDSAGEQKNPEARKMPKNGAESHQSAARFVGTLLTCETHCLKKYHRKPDEIIARTFDFGKNQKKLDLPKR
jgi:hypothetical protein